MIYCVITPELEAELGDRLQEYYRDNPDVQVIIERRQGSDGDRRRAAGAPAQDDRRVQRDRRRPRAMGTFPTIDAPDQ
jgi:hypothetical protein